MKTKGKAQIFLSRLLGKASRALHLIPPTLAMYSVEVTDADGRHVSGYKSKSNSWVRNAMNLMSLFALLIPKVNHGTSNYGDGYLNFKNTAGTTHKNWICDYPWGSSLGYSAVLYNNTFDNSSLGSAEGIVVGTSDATESFESYALGAKIAPGSGEGQLVHNAGTHVSLSWNTSARKWVTIGQRTFTNNSGSSITVKEIGYTKTIASKSSSNTYGSNVTLLIRDVLSTPQVVNNGQTLTVTFTIEFPY